MLPDNFFYFIVLFFIATFSGTYLLFSYHRNRLLILNAIMFFLCAIRVCTEFYFPQIESYEIAKQVATFHSLLISLVIALIWYCAWFYIRPFRGWQKEQFINRLYFSVFILVPGSIIFYGLLTRKIYHLSKEKIDGYWQFTVNKGSWLAEFNLLYSVVVMTFILVLLFLWSIYQHKEARLQKSLLMLLYVAVPIIFNYYYIPAVGEWIIPNSGILYLSLVCLLSWFLSDYRLFNNSFDEATKDLLNSISDLAIYTDLDLRMLHLNDNAQKVLPIRQNTLVDSLAINGTIAYPIIQQLLQNLVKGLSNNIEINLNDGVGGQRIFNIKVAPFKKNKEHLGYTFILTDLTNIRKKEQELEQSNAIKDWLFTIIGHDLRQPVLAFRGISTKVNYLIQNQEFDTLSKLGAHLESKALGLNNLMSNLLNWVLHQRQMLPYNPELIEIATITTANYQHFNRLAKEKGIDLQIHISQPLYVFCDLDALNTIIRNLVDNSIKYTTTGGMVQLVGEKIAEGVKLKVIDTGIGIQDEQLPFIFDVKKNRTSNGEIGSGLGLSLVKDLVEMNRGVITVNSKKDEGTVFEILLPAA